VRGEIEQAVELLKSGQPEAMEKALALLQETVFSFSMRVCQQREDAEDTMQEVLVKSVPYLSRFESPRALIVWLYKVAKNRCLMNRRKSKFAPTQELSLEALMPDQKELESIVQEGVNPEAFAIRSQEAQWLRAAIQNLPPQYRIVLVLRDMEGLTDEEVAEITGLRAGTVRVRLHRARLFVRKELMRVQGRGRRMQPVAPVARAASEPRPGRCKAMFAELSNYLDEQLDASMCDELERHLDGCGPCEAFLASLQAAIEQCRKAPAQCPNPRNAAKFRKQILKNYSRIASIRT
jgi:RNA polymerase sigma-70 factor (ECF subfamily)